MKKVQIIYEMHFRYDITCYGLYKLWTRSTCFAAQAPVYVHTYTYIKSINDSVCILIE